MIPHPAKPVLQILREVAGSAGKGQRTGKRQSVPMKLKEPKELSCLDYKIIMRYSLLKVKLKAPFALCLGVLTLYERD